MVNRMAVSNHKYGRLQDNCGPRGNIDALACLIQRLDEYALTGNTEFLIDAANFAMIEFIVPSHPHAHFKATDSDESPGLTTRDGKIVDGTHG